MLIPYILHKNDEDDIGEVVSNTFLYYARL